MLIKHSLFKSIFSSHCVICTPPRIKVVLVPIFYFPFNAPSLYPYLKSYLCKRKNSRFSSSLIGISVQFWRPYGMTPQIFLLWRGYCPDRRALWWRIIVQPYQNHQNYDPKMKLEVVKSNHTMFHNCPHHQDLYLSLYVFKYYITV